MCAIFGFMARRPDGRPCPAALARVARDSLPRGPHAFGFAWTDPAGRLHAFRQTGRITDHLALLASVAGEATCLIGHTRWATHGDPEDNVNNHPHPCDGGWVVHNGIVTNYDAVVRRGGLLPVSDCDSEAIGLLVEASGGRTLLDRCVDAAGRTTGPLAVLGLWSRPAAVVAVRRGNPLYRSSVAGGVYFATMPAGLPGTPRAVRDGRAIRLGRRSDGIAVTTRDLDPARGRQDRRALTAADVPLWAHVGDGAYRGG